MNDKDKMKLFHEGPVKKETVKFLRSNWCYGSSKIFNGKRIFFKLLWSFTVFLATVCCIYSLQMIFNDYYEYDTISRTDLVTSEEMNLPQVVICSHGGNESKLIDFVVEFELDRRKVNINDHIKVIKAIHPEGYIHECISLDMNRTTKIRLKQKEFNSPMTTGFLLRMNVSEDNPYATYFLTVLENLAAPYYSNPTMLVVKEKRNYVRLRKVVDIKLAKPYNDCIDDFSELEKSSDLVARAIKYNSFYQKSACYFLCKFKFYAEHYNCSYFGLYETNYSRSCLETVTQEKFFNTSLFKQKMCYNECPAECATLNFQVNKDYTNFFKGSSKDMIDIIVNFSKSQCMTLSQTPKTNLFDLISKIGGTLGLYIGFRLLSFIDILQYLLEIGYISFKKKSTDNFS